VCVLHLFDGEFFEIFNRTINQLIIQEENYIRDLDLVDSVFIKPLRASKPAVIEPSDKLEAFIDEVFSNVFDIRECNRRLLEILHVRQREQGPVIQQVGDILLEAATEFRKSYPAYVGNYPLAEKRLRHEQETNLEFRIFIEVSRPINHPNELLSILFSPETVSLTI